MKAWNVQVLLGYVGAIGSGAGVGPGLGLLSLRPTPLATKSAQVTSEKWLQ